MADDNKILYLDCHCGIAGDMTLAALLDLGVPRSVFDDAIAAMGLTDTRIVVTEVKKNGFAAKHVRVEHPEQHAHRHLHHIEKMIDEAGLAPAVADRAKSIFMAVAVAEAKVHGSTLQKVHFHEVGAIDSIVDIVCTAVGLEHLGVTTMVASPIPTGCGNVTIDHGNVSIPAPATLEILRGVPVVTCDIAAELTTPTGAAIVASQCQSFGPLPSMIVDAIGYGGGTMNIKPRANVLRLVLGHSADRNDPQSDRVVLSQTNLDDDTPERIAAACENLLAAGALDVWQTPIVMKKGRSGVMLSLLSDIDSASRLEQIVLTQTSSIGVRRTTMDRSKLVRQAVSVQTPWGEVAAKEVTLPSGNVRIHAEQDSVAELVRRTGADAAEVHRFVTGDR